MTERLVVIGGDAAGMSAASQARRRRSRSELEIVAYERSSYVSYAACGEPYHVAGYIDPLERLVARTPEQFAEVGIEVHLRHEVVAIDLDDRTVTVHDLDRDRTFETPFDQLLVATGAKAVRPPIEGIDLSGVYELRTLDDARVLRRVADREEGSVVVVGGGYIGLEVAEAFCVRGWEVTVLEAARSLLPRTFDADLGAEVAAALENMGIRTETGDPVVRIVGSDRVVAVETETEKYPADAVVLGIGTRPEVALAAEAGIPLGPTGAIAVDDHQRTPVDGVWAAGDCAETRHVVTGAPVNLHLGTVANKTGRIAGINLTGGDVAFPGVLGTAITKVCDLEIARTGLRESEAIEAGLDAVSATVSGTTTAHYWPEAAEVTVRATAERGTGRLLGAQIVGGPGAGKRIDVFATALWSRMTAEELSWVDLAYAPPFSGVWDIIHIAARKAAQAAGG